MQAESLIENDDITVKAKARAEEIMSLAERNVKPEDEHFDYIDSILYNFRIRWNSFMLHTTDMFNDIQKTDVINATLTDNRNEIRR